MEQSLSHRVKELSSDKRSVSALSDEQLIAEFQNSNEAAFKELVHRFKDPLTNYLFRFVGSWDDCNDLVQDTFVRVHRSRHSYKPIAKFSTWIYTIATNLAKSHIRRKKVRIFFSIQGGEKGDDSRPYEIQDERPDPEVRADSSLKEERIQDALKKLAVKYREVLVLREIQELSYEEIADITGINIGTVKSRINRGRARLQEMLCDLLEE